MARIYRGREWLAGRLTRGRVVAQSRGRHLARATGWERERKGGGERLVGRGARDAEGRGVVGRGALSRSGGVGMGSRRGDGIGWVRTQAAGASQNGADASTYCEPSETIKKIVTAPPTPMLSFSPCKTRVLQLLRPPSNPPLADFVRKELKLAGARLDPNLRAPSKMTSYLGMSLVPLTELLPPKPGKDMPITGIPEKTGINYASWSPDGKHIAFFLRSTDGETEDEPFSLWVASTETGEARQLLETPKYYMSAVFGTYSWLSPDEILVSVVPSGLDHGAPPTKPVVPGGPLVQVNESTTSKQSRTYPDLLRDEYDCASFEHYTTSDLVAVKISTGEVKPFSDESRIYTRMSPSPDKKYVIISYIERPFSYAVPCGRFPKRVELWSREGEMLREIAYLPLAEDIPISFNSCRRGPRDIQWRDDKPAELVYTIAADEGDPKVEVEEGGERDVVYKVSASDFVSGKTPEPFFHTDLRFSGILWCNDDLAFGWASWWKTRRSVWYQFSPGSPEKPKEILFDRNYEDAYSDPGVPVTRKNKMRRSVLATFEDDRYILLEGEGYSPKGNHPFLDLFDLQTRTSKRIWESKDPNYESVGSFMCDGDGEDFALDDVSFLLSRENPNEPSQYSTISWPNGFDSEPSEKLLSDFPHPHPDLKDLQKKVLRYKREDGTDLTATLYTPPGYDAQRDGPIPCLLWAYPREFKSKEAAGQIRKSSFTFSYIGGTSPLLFLAQKYAILDGPTFPIIGEDDEEPNDTFVKQLVTSAEAAIDKVVELGVADRNAVAVGGHSYGAFMTANLLAHAPDLFCCGIARSGAYNRTLTPFGFQAEERTIWQAKETYMKMSPYLYADEITKPILLIHGDEDNNTGTSKIQSERFFSALKGHGVPSKLVLLPHESHGYRAKESVLHCLHEMEVWLERYCNVVGEEASARQAVAPKL
ncbi:alpha/beta-hydrolase [Chloropicon primus]|uniref:Probable glutamyl endopeptidase, chloroplastic n=2 Tax=Chloropicon primus TaxID=1764295 RepID=A0A5B8MMS4_9CHLO|nr:alpha/beta-hydrolase [Chloropicon primus]UPR00125.1 alpha/beta-hydrolase [Chloropicon primus]|eukprot:QDZ20915.1 alpha/beta-hydrolase [Chloropicon primus]